MSSKLTTDVQRLVSEDEAAKYLAISPRTLRNWRTRGDGPKFVKISTRCIRYRLRDLLEWSEKRTRRSTSDLGFLR